MFLFPSLQLIISLVYFLLSLYIILYRVEEMHLQGDDG